MTRSSIIQKLKKTYEKCRKNLDPDYQLTAGVSSSEHWSRVADVVESMEADPVQYIRCQFSGCSRLFPFVTMLYSPAAKLRYTKLVQAGQEKQGIQLFKIQEVRLGRILERFGGTPDDVLLDPYNQFTPAFRVMMCSDEMFDSFMRTYGAAAKEQLDFDDSLSEYLQSRYDRTRHLRPVFSNKPVGTPVKIKSTPRVSSEGDLLSDRF